MSHEPRLEIYTINLTHFKKEQIGRVSFRDLFRTKFDFTKFGNAITREDIFKIFYQDFFLKIDTKGYLKNKVKKKAFTISYDITNDGEKSNISSPINAQEVISGILDGGSFGKKKKFWPC